MTLTLTKPMRQVAAVGLLTLAIALVLGLTVLPISSYLDGLQASIAEQRALLGRYQSFTANKDQLQRMAAESEAALRAGPFLGGETDAMRAASLQAHLTRVAQGQGVRLRSARTVPPTEHDGLRFIGVQVEFDTGLKQLQAIIVAFEAMRPHMFVQSLQIAPHDQHGNGADELKIRIGVMGAVPAGGKG